MTLEALFVGFPRTMDFLRQLAANNERAWFNANKALYETAYKAPAEAFIAELRPRLEALAERPLSAKLFRIHRDVRFSKDKSPYNAHLHIGFQPAAVAGEARWRGGFYFGLDAERVDVGVGAFDFGAADLDRYRKAVADDHSGGELAELLARLDARLEDPELKRTPAPYAADHPRGELLRRKGLNVWRRIDDPALIASPALADAVMAAFQDLDPVNLWLTEVLAP
jgi:uncharacterized protein (TIGR02453 family)